MKFTRRQFVKASAVGTAGILTYKFALRRAFPFEQSPTNLRKFIIGLPGLGPSAKNEIGQYIPVAVPNTQSFPGSDYYTLVAGQYTEQMHPDLPKATKFWGYADANGGSVFKYLGPVIVSTANRPVRLKMTNMLPPTHILPVDTSFFTDASTTIGGTVYQNKMAVHLHGGHVPWISDGGPFAWFMPAKPGLYGPDAFFVPDMPKPGKGSYTYYYPNDQSARLQWYHDHAHDTTRLNAYAGLASAFIITDDAETQMVNSFIIPSTQIPLIIQDKGFKSKADQWGLPGDLWYPSVYESALAADLPPMLYSDVANCAGTCSTARWEIGESPALTPLPVPSAVAEAFFDTILVNGGVFPYVGPLPAKRYRLRFLNGSQARFYNLQLFVDPKGIGELNLEPTGELDNNGNPILAPNNQPGPAFIQIGTEGGFLPAPVVFNTGGFANVNSNLPMGYDLNPTSPTFGNANRFNLLLAPAERADVIIDLRGYEGKTLVLYSDAPAPFPGGDIRNDYYTGAPDLTAIGGAPTPLQGMSPNTRTLMVIKVGATASDGMTFKQTINALQTQLPVVFKDTQPPPIDPSGIEPRVLTLNEDFDQWGRLIQLLGDVNGGRALVDEPTEIVHAGDTEVWRIFNTTGDTHPIHFHLVNVQIIGRAPFFDFNNFGTFVPPPANEAGWKETVRMNPGEVIDVAMKFDLPQNLPFTVPTGKRTAAGTGGYEYVWHCHILEHEEHDMMRPLIVFP